MGIGFVSNREIERRENRREKKRERRRKRRERRDEGKERRVGPTCHVDTTSALNGFFSTV